MDVHSEMIEVPGGMPALLARPEGGPRAAVLVIQEAFGLNNHIRDVARRVAAEGYVALAPDLYWRGGKGRTVAYDDLGEAIRIMQTLKDPEIVTDLGNAIAYLEKESSVRADRIGITGFCMGGRVSYLAACEVPEIRASVPFYGGAIAGQQFGPGASPPVAKTAKMKAAIQLHFGENDSYIPLAVVEEVEKALEREKKDFEVHVYKGAGHGFMCRERADYSETASKQAWDRTTAFLKKHLKS